MDKGNKLVSIIFLSICIVSFLFSIYCFVNSFDFILSINSEAQCVGNEMFRSFIYPNVFYLYDMSSFYFLEFVFSGLFLFFSFFVLILFLMSIGKISRKSKIYRFLFL